MGICFVGVQYIISGMPKWKNMIVSANYAPDGGLNAYVMGVAMINYVW